MRHADVGRSRTDADRGIVMLELMLVVAIIGVLAAMLAVVISSAYSGTNRLRRDTDAQDRAADVAEVFRSITSAAAVPGTCAERDNPATTASSTNCLRLGEAATSILTATASTFCVWSRESDAATATGPGGSLLTAPGVGCLSLSAAGRVEAVRRTATASDYIAPSAAAVASNPSSLVEGVVAGDRTASPIDTGSAVRYFDVAGTELVPATGSPAALSDAQKALVWTIRFAVTVLGPEGDAETPIVLVGPLGSGAQSRGWSWGA